MLRNFVFYRKRELRWPVAARRLVVAGSDLTAARLRRRRPSQEKRWRKTWECTLLRARSGSGENEGRERKVHHTPITRLARNRISLLFFSL